MIVGLHLLPKTTEHHEANTRRDQNTPVRALRSVAGRGYVKLPPSILVPQPNSHRAEIN
jgi:hypothetical protein